MSLISLSVELPEFASPIGFTSMIVSPDGRRIVYTGRSADGKWRLYTRRLDQEKVTPLAGTENKHSPFFSPDGQSLGFFSGDKMKKILVLGGGEVVLSAAPLGEAGARTKNIIAALATTGSLTQVHFTRRGSGAQALGGPRYRSRTWRGNSPLL